MQKNIIIPFPRILNMKKLLHIVYGAVKWGDVNSGAVVTSEGGRKGGWELPPGSVPFKAQMANDHMY